MRLSGEKGKVHEKCEECGKLVDVVVEIGEPPEYDSITPYVCESCLRKALALIEHGGKEEQ